jgi:transcriptional regulator with XRE-family HTH domain
MTDAQIGRVFRAVRHRMRHRQQDVAERAHVSRQLVSRIERGRLDEVSAIALRAVADALEIRLETTARWRGGDLDRLLNRRHAAMHEAAIALFDGRGGWTTVSELSFNVWGERGIIDLAAWHEERRVLVINELKSEFVDPGELVGTMDRRRRLAADIARSRGWEPKVIAVWVLVEDTRTNRRHLAASRRLLRGAFPADGHAMLRWLSDPTGPIAGLSFLSPARLAVTRQRVRIRSVLDNRPKPSEA